MRSLRIGLFMATILLLSLAIGCGGGGGGGGGGPVLGGISIIENISPGGKILAGTQYNLKVQPQGGTNWTFQWASNHSGDVFGTSTSKTTTYTPSAVTADTNVEITCNGVPDGGTAQVSKIQFIITKNTNPYIKVTRPNGGEEFYVSTDEEITWDSEGVTGNVKIEYSADNFVNTTVLAPNAQNTGSWTWPDISVAKTSSALIRITSLNNTALTDDSDETFSIKSCTDDFNLTVPNGGENWHQKIINQITWISGLPAGTKIDIDYSSDNFVNDIQLVAVNVSADAQTYDWKITVAWSDTGRIRLRLHDSLSCYDISDNTFKILPNGIYVDKPAEDEIFWSNTPENIEWHSDIDYGDVNIEVNYGDGVWHTLASDVPNAGAWTWDTVPDEPTNLASIKIYFVNFSDVKGISETFVIRHPPSPIITAPIMNEIVKCSNSYMIKWYSEISFGQVKIEARYGGSAWETLTPSTDDDGEWLWDPVPCDKKTDQAQIKITFVSVPDINGVSDPFTILEISNPTFTHPALGEQLTCDVAYKIQWVKVQSFGPVKLEVQYGDSIWETLTDSTDDDGEWLWDSVPCNQTTNAQLKISYLSNPDDPNVSGTFEIGVPTIYVTKPCLDDLFCIIYPLNIEWDTEYLSPTGKVKIDYYVGGSFKQTIAGNTENDGSYFWDASKTNPNPESHPEMAFIRITSNDIPSVYGDSELFDYCHPYVHHIFPGPGDKVTNDTTIGIQWQSLGVDNIILTIVDNSPTLKYVSNASGEWTCDDPEHAKTYTRMWHVGDTYPWEMTCGGNQDFCFTMYWRWVYNPTHVWDMDGFYVDY